MSQKDYSVSVYDFPRLRLVRSIVPASIADSDLSIIAWQFLETYDTDLPIAVLSDYTHADWLSDAAISLIGSLIKKSFADEQFVAAVWVTGTKDVTASSLRGLLETLGHDPSLVVRTEAEAFDILRRLGAGIPDEFAFPD